MVSAISQVNHQCDGMILLYLPILRDQNEVRKLKVTSSVTRFGEILPFYQNFKSPRPIFDFLLNICQNFEPTLAHV